MEGSWLYGDYLAAVILLFVALELNSRPNELLKGYYFFSFAYSFSIIFYSAASGSIGRGSLFCLLKLCLGGVFGFFRGLLDRDFERYFS